MYSTTDGLSSFLCGFQPSCTISTKCTSEKVSQKVALSAPNLAANSAMVVNLYSGVVAKVVIGYSWLRLRSATERSLSEAEVRSLSVAEVRLLSGAEVVFFFNLPRYNQIQSRWVFSQGIAKYSLAIFHETLRAALRLFCRVVVLTLLA